MMVADSPQNDFLLPAQEHRRTPSRYSANQYANATTAQTDYYGMEALKDQLKARYHVTCVLWN
jgi:hypothetical protein